MSAVETSQKFLPIFNLLNELSIVSEVSDVMQTSMLALLHSWFMSHVQNIVPLPFLHHPCPEDKSKLKF